ncbi:hypothetical protein MMC26_002057 [Xylographa opegraphella]|nr:hypothetical protein [Xylographa opegraphella]
MAELPNNMQIVDFNSPERTKQLEIIDKLHDLGVGKEISLPVLVVVGDQSSGKSSLLEGLTTLPFPIASQLCTRFATQVSFPTDAADDYKAKLSRFAREVTVLSSEKFSEILAEAAVLMGLPSTTEESEIASKRFSRDVLKIEIVGPQQNHLSVVDVPGLYHNPIKAQTSEDLGIIRSLIGEYVNDPRTIIMAVLDARNNLANQEVFKIAKSSDALVARTIGVMTKLDALQPGDEKPIIAIARNEVETLKHGWHCVRNRSTQDINDGVSAEERDRKEKEFFSKAPWNSIEPQRTGIAHLKTNLGRLLSKHIAREFPDIRKEIDAHYVLSCKQLEKLGPPRQSTQEQRQHLTKIATLYQRAIEEVSNGRYRKAGNHPSKLRMHLQNASDCFAQNMQTSGKTMEFKSTDDKFEELKVESDELTESCSGDANLSTEEDFVEDGAEVKPSNMYEEIHLLWRSARGIELFGHVNPSVVETLFNFQTSKWPLLANKHMEKIITIIQKCHNNILKETCSDESIRTRLCGKIDPDAESAFEAARAELAHLLVDERDGPLLTNDPCFAENLAKARADRFANGLKKLGLKDKQPNNYINYDIIKNGIRSSNEQTAIYDIHDTLKAYYDVALPRFVDNVSNQVVQRSLMGRKGPVSILTPEWVAGLDADDLVEIAGENPATSALREELNAAIGRLQKARKLCSGKTDIS